MLTTLTIREHLFKEVKGKSVCIKRNVTYRREIDTNDILEHAEVYNKHGKIIQRVCAIKLKDDSSVIVNHSFDYISELKRPVTVKGFNNGRKKRK